MSASSNRRSTTGDEIRAKIEANRQKRLSISEAMKREAGVTEHWINPHDDSGWARLEDRVIYAPEGKNIRLLTTVAHECGHAFLHHVGNAGVRLASHVKEMEAESYAHQAMLFHGMSIPAWRTQWGRGYVASWIAKDAAQGVPIDPRVRDYADGRRSPFEPLRLVPSTWLADPRMPRPVPAPASQPAVRPVPRPVYPPVSSQPKPPPAAGWLRKLQETAQRSLSVAVGRAVLAAIGDAKESVFRALRGSAVMVARLTGLAAAIACYAFVIFDQTRIIPPRRILEPGVFVPEVPDTGFLATHAWLIPFGIAFVGVSLAFAVHAAALQQRLQEADEFRRRATYGQSPQRLTFRRWHSVQEALRTAAVLAAFLTTQAHHRDWSGPWEAVLSAVAAAAFVWPVLGVLAAEALFLPTASDRARLRAVHERQRVLRELKDRVERAQAAGPHPQLIPDAAEPERSAPAPVSKAA